MTIACVWLNNSSGRSRITAVSDSLASSTANGVTTPLTDATVKLMPITVQCHRAEDFDSELERFLDPYYETELGIAYCGDCFVAYNIIALFTRAMSQLVTTGADEGKPSGKGISEALAALTGNFFRGAQGYLENTQVQFLLFGFEPRTGTPWLAEVDRAKLTFHADLSAGDFFSIGDGTNAHDFLANIKELRARIRGHASGLVKKLEDDADFALALEKARHQLADRKIVEDKAIELIESSFVASVGGELQKLEVYPDGDRAWVCHTAGLGHHILQTLPAFDGLCFPMVVERFGRGVR